MTLETKHSENPFSTDLLETASFGGPGWQARILTHRQELHSQQFWNPCGVSQEWATLKTVLLAWPQESLNTNSIDETLLIEKVDLKTIRSQTERLAFFYEEMGIDVILYKPKRIGPPNLIFMRDSFFMTPEGAFLGRAGGQARAGEEVFVAEALATNQIPIVRATLGSGCFEGADALWMSDRQVLLSEGFRTNTEGARQVTSFLNEIGVSLKSVKLPRGTQHLLGAINWVNQNQVAVREDLLTEEIKNVLHEHDIFPILIPVSEESVRRRSLNFVTLGPNRIVMPSHCPMTRTIYESYGIECFEIDVSEYIKAGGALGCITGIIQRSGQHSGQSNDQRSGNSVADL